MSEPTPQDQENAARRQDIADRQNAEYARVLAWARQVFGRGWEPCGRYYLLDKDEEDRCRSTGERPQPAATCYIAVNCIGRKRCFTIDGDTVTERSGYKEAFGDMLLEPHPTQRIEVKGQMVAPHRYSLCWASIELYEPRTPEQLAKFRASREAGKERRKQERFAEENPLLAQAGIKPEDVARKEDKGRKR